MELEHGSGISKHSRTHPEIIDGSRSKKYSETNPEFIDGSGSIEHCEIQPLLINGIGSSKQEETHTVVTDGSKSSKHLETRLIVFDGSDGSSEHSEPEAEVSDGSDSSKREDKIHPLAPAIRLGSCSSFSSLEDLFQMDTIELTKSGAHTTPIPKSDENTDPTLKHESSFPSNSSSKSEEHENSSSTLTSTSQNSDITHESVHSLSPTQSPQIQVMDRSIGYDPYRIPSSVFGKSTTPMEWSVASNESLFSIHVGNNSFSRDHVSYLNDIKSGELAMSDEFILFSQSSPISGEETHRKSTEIRKESGDPEVANHMVKNAARVNSRAKSEEKVSTPTISLNPSRRSYSSDGSGTSSHSFAFPIKKKCAWPSSYCSNCSRAFRYCTWPCCYCSKCSWAFCYSWNCSLKRLCCHSSTILAEARKSGPVEADAKKLEHQVPPPSRVNSHSTSDPCCPCLGSVKADAQKQQPFRQLTHSNSNHCFPCLSWCPWGGSCRNRRCCHCCY